MIDLRVQAALGGSVYSVIAYFTLQHCVYAQIVTHLAVIVGGVTLKRHKMVNLCPTTYEIARNMKNFSKFVREQLLKQDTRNTYAIEYHMWCPDHPEYIRVSDNPPRFGMYCTTCDRQMEGKWVNVS